MKKLMMLLAALGVSTLFAKCACPGDKLTGAPSWAPAPLKALSFETGGDAKWTTDNVESNSIGVAGKVLRSGAIKANQSSWAQVRVKGAGRLTFSWKVSSESGNDGLVFDVCRACTDPEHCRCCKGYSEEDCSCAGCEHEWAHDVSAERVISGLDGEWETVTIEFRDNDTRFEGDGSETNLIEHIVRWTYVKNEVLNRGEDCGWLDNVTWASAGGNLKTYENCDWGEKWMSGPGETITVTFDTNGGQYTNELESAFKKVSNGVYKRSDFKFARKYDYFSDKWMWNSGDVYGYYSAYSTNIMTNEFGDVTNFTQVVTQFPTNEIVRKGYEFLGWFTSKEGLRNLGEPVFEDDPVSPTNITLYARWRQVESDEGLDLFHGLGFGAMKDGAQKTCIAETLTTNEWIACAKGGVDGGKMAMNLPIANSSFSFVITNDTGSATGTDGVLSFDWRVTDCSLAVEEERVTYGWWATEAFTTNDVGEYVVKVDGFKPRFVRQAGYDGSYKTLWSSEEVERDEDDDAGIWKHAEVGTCFPDPDVTSDDELTFDDGKYMTTNAVKRVMKRLFQVYYDIPDEDPLQAAQIAKMTWTPVSTVKVVFDANGGTVEGKAKYEKEYAPGYAFDFEEADSNLWNNVKHPLAGAEFAGWWTEPFGGEDAAGDDYALPCTNGVVTLFAHWTIPVADAIGLPGQRIVGDEECCNTNMTWFGIVGAPDGVPYAARSIDIGDGESAWMETVFDVKEDSFLTFKWMASSELNCDLFSLWVDGQIIASISGQAEWEVMRVLLAAGTHTIKWEYSKNERGEEGDDAAYLADVAVSKVDLKNLVDWLDVLHADGYWETNKLAKFAAAYTNKFISAKVDEVARARFGHAICTVLALGENEKVLEALHDAGYGVAYQPYDYTNFLNYAFGDYANKQVIEHLESIKGESDNDRYMKFANEAIAAYKAAIADLDAITNGWKGSFTIAATGKHLDASGVAYTNDVVVDIADINMVKANFNGMLSQIQFVGAHDVTLDHDKVIETITTRPAIARTPTMSGSYMCIGGKLLKANEENLLIDEETRARNKAYILKTYGDGSEWDIVPALPLKSAPYAEVEQSGSVQIAMCGGTSVSAARNSNRLYFKVDANTVDDWSPYVGKALVATFIDEIADKPVTVTVNLGSDVQWYQIDNNFEVFNTYYTDTSAWVNSDAFGGDELYSVGATSIGNTLWVEVDLAQNDLGEYAEYHPLHWTIFSVQVLDDFAYDRYRDVVVSEAPAPSMTGNADDWKRVKAYSISGEEESIAESMQCVRNGTNVYIRLTGLDPKFAPTNHTFESLYVKLSGENYDFDGYVDTEKVVFTGDSVEICFVPPEVSDPEDLSRLTLEYVACACSDEDDEHPWWNEVYPYAWATGDISEGMRWHSVLTHYEDITAVLKEQPDFLKNIRDKGLLGDAKETMRVALTSYLAADDGIEARTDEAQHLYWHAAEQKADLAELHVVVSNALAALDAPQKVNFALLSKALARIRGDYEDKYLDGPRFETFIPDQMKCALQSLDFRFDGDVNIDLGKLFETGLTRNFLPQFEDCWPVLETLPDPTFGGLFPEMTLGEWLGSYMGRGLISLDTYNEIYPHMTTKMPSQLKVRQYVSGEGYVTFTTDLREAMPNAHISCAVDGVDQAVTEFAPSHVSSGVWVKGKGEHEIVWTIISGGLTEEKNRVARWDGNGYGMYWCFDPSWYGLRDADYRQHNDVIPLKNVVFSDGLKLIAKRRKGGSIDFGFDDDTPFAVGAAQTFQGELLEEGKVAGSVTVKVDKKGVVSATVTRMDGTKESFKKGAINEAGIVEFEGGLTLTLGTNKLSGSLGEGLEIAGVRNVFASKDAADKTKAAEAMAKWQNTYVFAMEAINPEEAGPFVNGYGVFTLTVGKNGKSKLAGFMPDGTKVSYSTQMLLGEKDAHVPITVPLYKKAGGIGMDIVLGEEASLDLAGVSGWKMSEGTVADWTLAASGVTSASGPLPGLHAFHMTEAFAFEMDCCEEALPTEIRPEEITIGSNGKWSFEKAAKVKNVGGEWEIDDSKGTNFSGVKLSYKAATGLYKGTFVVYALEGGKVKKYKATVNGAEIEGVGYGSAVIKDKGVAPVMIYLMSED